MLTTNNKSKSSKLRVGIAGAALCASFLLATNANQTVKADDITSQENQTGSEVAKDVAVTNAKHPDIPVQVVGSEDADKTAQTESNTTNSNKNNIVTSSETNIPTIVRTDVADKTAKAKPKLQGRAVNTSDNTWDNAQTDYDDTNHTLTIKGGSLTDPNPIYKQFATKANEMQAIKITGKTVLAGSVKGLFSNLTNLTSIEGIENLDTVTVTNMSAMFQNDQKLVSFGVIDSSDVDSAGNKQIIASLEGWATDNVTDMSYMFQGCNSLYGLLLNVPTTKVQNFSHFASDCANLFLFRIDYSEASSANVTDWSYMLANDPELKVAYVFFNTENDTSVDSTASHMFYNDAKLEQVAFVGFSSLTDTSYMFANDTNVSDYLVDWIANQLDADKMAKLTNMSHMFENCTNLSYLHLNNFSTNDKLKADKTDMFKGLNSLQQIDLGQNVNLNGTGFMPPFRYTAIDVNTGAPTDKIYTATQLRKFWNNQTSAGAFVGTPVKYYNVTINFVDTKTGKTLKSIAKYGNSEDPLEFKDDFTSVIKELTKNGNYTYDAKNNKVPLDKNGDIQLPSDIKSDVTYTVGLTPKEVPVNPTPNPTPTPDPTPNIPTVPTDTIITNVIVHYQDESGNKLQADKTITGKLGGSWNAVPAEIKGYHLVDTKGMATGTISDVRQEVTFVYTKDQPAKPTVPNKPANKPIKPNKKPSKNKNCNKHRKPIVIDHGVILKPVNQQVSKETSANPTIVKSAYADTNNSNKHNNTSYDNKLPQTGTDTKNNGNLVLLGLGSLLTAMLSLFGISKKKKL